MTFFQDALYDYKLYLDRGAEPIGAAWRVAGFYRNVCDEVDLAKSLLATQEKSDVSNK